MRYTLPMSDALFIPPLEAGGIVLGYRCPARCRHCLYGCGPHRSPMDVPPEALEKLLDGLARHGPRVRYHVGGGEPFLDLARLGRVVRGLAERHLCLDYVETNASWVRSRDQAEEVLAGLAEDGLNCVLVSLSPFHAEHIPLSRTLHLVAAARRVLPEGAFVWMPHFLEDLSDQDPESVLDLQEHLLRQGDGYARELSTRYALVPGGRAGRFLHVWGQRIPWERLTGGGSCARRLGDTTHFHVDLEGRYVPGLCAGICLPFEEVPGPVDLDRYPVLHALVRGGVGALVEYAMSEAGFQPRDTYGSACDLCAHARGFLLPLEYDELAPVEFYDTRSLGGWGGL